MDYSSKKYSDILFRTVDGAELKIDFIAPDPLPDKPAPCAVFYFGGGWCEGSRKDLSWFPLITDDLVSHGFIVAAPDYRLVGKNGGHFPGSVEDCLYALKFIDEQTFLPIDKNRKAVYGISAGGYMALMSVLYQDVAGIHSPVNTVVDMCGIVYMKGNDKPYSDIQLPPTTVGFINDFIGNADPEYANPITLADKPCMRPSVMIVHGDSDECVNTEMSRLLYEKLGEKGFFVRYLEVGNSNHTFNPVNGKPLIPKAQDLYAEMSGFIKENT